MAHSKSQNLIFLSGLLLISILGGIAWGASKFPPISGQVYGQAVPGVKSLTINGKAIPLDNNLNFRTVVNLKEGEKYLTLNINYGSFRIIKKYTIIRKPQVKTFKVYVPKENIQKPAGIAPLTKKRRLLQLRLQANLKKLWLKQQAQKKAAREQKLRLKRSKAKGGIYQYVWEFTPGKLLLVKKVKGVYSADIFIPATMEWSSLEGLTLDEFKTLIDEPLPDQAQPAKGKDKKKK